MPENVGGIEYTVDADTSPLLRSEKIVEVSSASMEKALTGIDKTLTGLSKQLSSNTKATEKTSKSVSLLDKAVRDTARNTDELTQAQKNYAQNLINKDVSQLTFEIQNANKKVFELQQSLSRPLSTKAADAARNEIVRLSAAIDSGKQQLNSYRSGIAAIGGGQAKATTAVKAANKAIQSSERRGSAGRLPVAGFNCSAAGRYQRICGVRPARITACRNSWSWWRACRCGYCFGFCFGRCFIYRT